MLCRGFFDCSNFAIWSLLHRCFFKINKEVFEETGNYVEKNIVVENCDDLVHEFHISDDDEEQEKKSPSELKSENNMQ